jgi:hypothetical protein
MNVTQKIAQAIATVSELSLDKIGRWNPQLMRELQGRLRWRNVLLTLIPTILVQVLIVLKYVVRLPVIGPMNRYCMGSTSKGLPACDRLPGAVEWQTNWPLFWSDILKDLSLVLPWVIILGGVYLLAADLSKETRRGTLNFLRMSPQQGRQILLGKLLGVPVLLYLALVATLPLHGFAAWHSGFDFAKVLAFYGVLAATTFCFYAAGLWFALVADRLQGFQPWLATGLVTSILMVGTQGNYQGSALNWARLFNPLSSLRFFQAVDVLSKDNLGTAYAEIFSDNNGLSYLGWWYSPIGADFRTYTLLAISNALGFGLIYWLLLERRFRSPAATLISKRQSYGLSLWASVWFVGFDLQSDCGDYCSNSMYDPGTAFASGQFTSFLPCFVVLGLLLMILLLPTSQTLIDWARYRRQSHRTSKRNQLLQDLLWQDNSPPTLAFAVNGLIALIVLGLGISVQNGVILLQDVADLWVTWGLCELLLLNAFLLVQRLAISDLAHWRWVAIAALLTLGIGVPMGLSVLGINIGESWGSLWLFSATRLPSAIGVASWESVAIAFALHLSFATLLTTTFNRRLGQLGQSEWKALMENQSVQRG